MCIEYFSNGFSGWTYNGSLELFAMKFYPVQDELNIGYVLNPKVSFKAADAYQGLDYTFSVTLDDLSDITEMTVQYQTTGAAVTLTAASVEGKVYEPEAHGQREEQLRHDLFRRDDRAGPR